MLSTHKVEMMAPILPVGSANPSLAGARRTLPASRRLLLLLALVAAMLLVPLVQGVGASAEETASNPDVAARQLNALAAERALDLVRPR